MILPVELVARMKEACQRWGIYCKDGNNEVFACRPTDEALKLIEEGKDAEVALANCWYGNNVYVLQWHGDGIRGMRKMAALLAEQVGPGGVLAGERHHKPRRWNKEFFLKGA